MLRLFPSEASALGDLGTWLRGRFGARVREFSLFGSKARGNAHEESDVDVLVVIDGLTGREARDIAHFAGDLLTRWEARIAPFAVSAEHMAGLRARERRIAREIDADAVAL